MQRSVKEANNLNLKQCLAIKDNQYRSVNNEVDYYPESVEARIIEIYSNQVEAATNRALKDHENFEKFLDKKVKVYYVKGVK